ncbi:MAG: hypothetical protein V3U88_10315 [Methylococcales bacterium]
MHHISKVPGYLYAVLADSRIINDFAVAMGKLTQRVLRNEQEITSTTDLSFYLSSALQKQLHSSLELSFCALKTNNYIDINWPASVVEVISCSFLNRIVYQFPVSNTLVTGHYCNDKGVVNES